MASVTFTSTSISPTNVDCKKDKNIYISFQKSDGTLPPSGSTLKKITVYFTRLNVYTDSCGFDTAYGRFSFSSGDGSKTATATSPNSAILNFTGGEIIFTVWSAGNGNALNPKAGGSVTLTVEYETRSASTGRLNTTNGQQGGTISLSITSVSSEFTHKVVWTRDSSHSTEQNLSAGVSSTTLTVPSSWPVGSATCKLYTYFNGSQVGSVQTYNWTVVVDQGQTFPTGGTITPSLVQDSKVPSSWGVYVQGFSKVKLTLSGHAAGTSASISNILLAIGSQKKNDTSAAWTSGVITESGSVQYSGKVTNNFGNTVDSAGGNITVYPYESPRVTSVIAFRCLQDGTPNDFGTYMSITAYTSYSSVNGKNSIVSMQCQFSVNGSNVWSAATNISNGVQSIISGLNDTESIYIVRVTVIDQIQNLAGTSTTNTSVVLTSECILFFRDGGLGVSIGKQGLRDRAVEISSDWDIWWGDEKLNGTVPIARGGTGATTVAEARNALGLGNTDGALPIANGGTGQTTAAGIRNAIGLGNTDGVLPVANGGTGSNNASGARTNLGITPANIGAAPTSHNHSAGNITSGTLAAARLPFKIAAGVATLSGASWSTINYGTTFSNTPVVVCTWTDDATSSGINVIKTRSRGTSSFQVCMAGSGSGSRNICWLAYGT